MISGFVVFNVIVAVVCDGVATMKEEERKEAEETTSVASQRSSNSEFIFIAKKSGRGPCPFGVGEAWRRLTSKQCSISTNLRYARP